MLSGGVYIRREREVQRPRRSRTAFPGFETTVNGVLRLLEMLTAGNRQRVAESVVRGGFTGWTERNAVRDACSGLEKPTGCWIGLEKA